VTISLIFLIPYFFSLEKCKTSHFHWYFIFQSTLTTTDENLLPIAIIITTLSSLDPNIVGKNIFSNLKPLKFYFRK